MLGLITLVAAVFAACGSSDDDRESGINVDLQPIQELAHAASSEADRMEEHADSMAAAAASRPDLAHWESDAEVVRAEARSLRLLASWATAIQYDPGAQSDSHGDIQRILGDGRNLQELGETLIVHADAMLAHVEVMREQAAGDSALLATVSDIGTDSEGMRQSGQAAIDRGKELEEIARQLARSIGEEID